MKSFAHRIVCSAFVALLATTSPCTFAADATEVEQLRATTLKLIELLIQQGVLSRDKADALLKEAAQTSAPAAPATAASTPAASVAPGTVRVPLVPEFVRKELKEELRKELSEQAKAEGWAGPWSVPEWVKEIKLDGDLRVRYQHDGFTADNAPQLSIIGTNNARALTLLNTTEDRDRLRVRARIGLTANLDKEWSAGVRLTTGSLSDPNTSNQTAGNYENRYQVAFDRAYIRYHNSDWFGLNALAGRFGNPWFGTDLVWTPDLSFDGLALQVTPKITDSIRGFATIAGSPIQEVELSKRDKWLVGGQVGLDFLRTSFDGVAGKIGVAYYNYINVDGQLSPDGSTLNEFTAPQFAQKGNSYYNISSDPNRPLLGLAGNYRLFDVTGQIDFSAYGANHLILTADYVRNFGFDSGAVSARVGQFVGAETVGYQVRAAFGRPEVRARHDWQVFAAYKRLERDAVLDAFTDTDFRLGGTDSRGFVVGGSYGLGRNTAGTFRYISADAISGAPFSVDVLQFDLTTRF